MGLKMMDRIRGKVAKILNSREIAISVGSASGVVTGMYFDVVDPKGEDITDPDTGEMLGSVERPKVRVQVIQVQEKLSIASTYKKEKFNVGGAGAGFLSGLGLASKALMPPKYIVKYETLKMDEKTWEDLDEEKSYVKIGDPVVQVIEEITTES
jgi:hypothetical protein